MKTKKQILKQLQNLKYFNLYPISPKPSYHSINPKSDNQFERLKREVRLINALQTASRYLTCYDDLDILTNPKQEITKAQFLHNIVNGEELTEDVNGIIVNSGFTKYGLKMSEKELMIYVDVALELYGQKME